MDAQEIVRGFPLRIREDATAVAGVLPQPQHRTAYRAQRVLVQGDQVAIPYRIYSPQPADREAECLSERQRLIGACIYSRHHDGRVRESSCAAIIASTEPWVAPYVIHLLGEYVVEISTLILARLTSQSSFTWPAYQEFARANTPFIELTQQRAISYWSCYHRHAFTRDTYPALVALERLRQEAAL